MSSRLLLQLFERQAAEDTGLQFTPNLPKLPDPPAAGQPGGQAARAGIAQSEATRGTERQPSASRAQGTP